MPDAGFAAAWPLPAAAEPGMKTAAVARQRRQRVERGLLGTQDRGIILNLAETTPSRWTKGVMPDVPVWLTMPTRPARRADPASADEARAILRALQALYVTVTPAAAT